MNVISKFELDECTNYIARCREEVSKRVVGQKEVIDGIIMAMIAGGHVLLEGVPGLAKTLAVKTFADISGLEYKRIQFTPDLLPADVSGTLIYEQGKFTVRKGPVFSNLVLADEINRAPAKVQSALLEAMAEHQVTIGETSYKLHEPFFVLATQNPIEQEGTYNLPEAELDRFLLKLIVPYPTPEEEIQIVKSEGRASDIAVNRVFSSSSLEKCRNAVDAVTVDDKMLAYIVSIVNVTRADTNHHDEKKISLSASNHRSDIQKYISFGASPRAGIALLRCAKVHALFENRSFVLAEDIQAVAKPVLRHRLVLNYEAAADSVTADDLISKIIDFMPVP
ncbi:MAG: MoxR family ATPase [Treponema sp.]|nr:MoxR family ATPase [Spirochaetia bacterium]MDD7580198.1 MoxR family ATPase [Treponema sp.]MDY3758047.1 MoxR family ATPase [Treponema sp.]MDY4131156.1 MoxR family ATPase [Treponema sp.]MDY5837604.1 MoxR family ATPase [Treponema sp.]